MKSSVSQDNVVIIVRGKFDSIITNRMQSALNCTWRWCQNEGLNINHSKAGLVLGLVPFTRRRKITLKTLEINGSILQYSSNAKYLGVILDDKLNWNLHLQYR